MLYKLIVAFDIKRGIGKNGTIPWYFPEDLKRFSKLTKGNGNNAIIMGRKTWTSLPQYPNPLPKRDNLILSNTLNISQNSPKNSLVQSFNKINELTAFCKSQNYDEVWVIGGAEIYSLFLEKKLIDEIYVTTIYKNYNCDTHFPTHLLWWAMYDLQKFNTADGTRLIYTTYRKNQFTYLSE